MKNIYASIIAIIPVLLGTLLPHVGYAACTNKDGLSYCLENPIAFNSIQDLLVAILNLIIVIATPIIVIFIIFAGFKYVTAQGNPGEIEKATKALTYAVIGGVLIIGAVAISQIIGGLVKSFEASDSVTK